MNFELERKANKIVFNEDQSKYIIHEYFVEERAMNSIGKDFSCAPQVIARTIRENGLQPREVGASNRLYTANDDYFSVINSERKAYWLGFLYADGTVNEKRGTVTLGLMSEDVHHIEKFIDDIESTNPIFEVEKTIGDKTFYSKRVNIYSRKMVNDLVGLGCFQNKSLTLKFPSKDQVSDDFLIPFIRGYFDGDGSISYTKPYSNRRQYRFSVLGTEEFINVLKETMEVSHLKTQKARNHYYLATTGGKQTKFFLEKLYQNAEIYLDRKHNKYKEMLEYGINNPVVPWNKKL